MKWKIDMKNIQNKSHKYEMIKTHTHRKRELHRGQYKRHRGTSEKF